MDRQFCEVLLVCCVQVTPESVDVYMKPPSTTAASFCMRMIGWERLVSTASMVLHVLAIVPTRRVRWQGQNVPLHEGWVPSE